MINNNILDQYRIVYEVTCLPTIIFSQMVKASEVLRFDDFYIPTEFNTQAVECRVSIFNGVGLLIEMSSDMLPGYSKPIISYLNVTPLTMIERLLKNLVYTNKSNASNSNSSD